MIAYFDTLGSDLFHVAKKLVDAKKIEKIYTVVNPLDVQSHDEKKNLVILKEYVDTAYIRQDVFMNKFENYCYFNECPPVDEDIIEYMHPFETEILKMIERSSYQVESFEDRMRSYYAQLRYWNGMIENAGLEVVFFSFPPHAVHDYIIYRLCKRKGIKTLLSVRCPVQTESYLHFCTDYKDICPTFKILMEELKEKYKNTLIEDIELTVDFQKEYDKFYKRNVMVGTKKETRTKDLIKAFKWYFADNKTNALKKVLSRLKQDNMTKHLLIYYKKIEQKPDYSKKYIYFPLQYQPEMTTSPLGGVFVHQYLAIKMLSFYLPEDILIYVKEHPLMKYRSNSRNKGLYIELQKLNNVIIVPMETGTEQLLNNCIAVASMTGTILYEAFYRLKPYIMFGERTMKYSPGVFNVRNNKDCKETIQYILKNGAKHDLKDVRIFLKALSMTTYKAIHNLKGEISESQREENAVSLYKGYLSIM